MGYWWVLPTIINYCALSWASYKSNAEGGFYMYAVWLIGVVPLWSFVARYSKNLAFDGLLYDCTMTVSYALSILYFTGSFKSMTLYSYIGLLAIVCGLVMFKNGL